MRPHLALLLCASLLLAQAARAANAAPRPRRQARPSAHQIRASAGRTRPAQRWTNIGRDQPISLAHVLAWQRQQELRLRRQLAEAYGGAADAGGRAQMGSDDERRDEARRDEARRDEERRGERRDLERRDEERRQEQRRQEQREVERRDEERRQEQRRQEQREQERRDEERRRNP